MGDSEPDWVASERKVFQTERDSDGDGFMTFEEIKQWIIPEVRGGNYCFESQTGGMFYRISITPTPSLNTWSLKLTWMATVY